MYEEHLCVVALTSIVRGTHFRLPLTSLCDLPLLFVYFQVNNGALYFLDYEDNLHHGPLCSRFNVVQFVFIAYVTVSILLLCLMVYVFLFFSLYFVRKPHIKSNK